MNRLFLRCFAGDCLNGLILLHPVKSKDISGRMCLACFDKQFQNANRDYYMENCPV